MTDKELDELEAPPHRPQRKGNPMTPEEKPFDTSRIPVFYQNGSVKVGDKEYAPGEYPLGADTMTEVDTRILKLIAGVELGAYRGANDERVEMSQADYKEAAQLIEALAAERDELERLAEAMAADIVKFRVALDEATDWNWIDEDAEETIPQDVQDRIAELSTDDFPSLDAFRAYKRKGE